MSAFPVIAFHAAPRSGAIVFVIFAHVDHRSYFRAVIAGEHDQGVVRHAQSIEGLGQLADDVIQLEDKVAVGARLGFAFKRITGKRRQVDRLCRMKQEEGFPGRVFCMVFKEFYALVEEDHIDFLQVEIRGDHARAIIT